MNLNIRKVIVPLGLAVLLYVAYDALAWKGIAAVAGGIVMWLLLHFTRLMTIMRRASNTPIGYVGSAVMLNVKLKPKVPLIHVVALTRSLGQRLSLEGQEPETYRWTDGTHSHVTCEFVGGRLMAWQLYRPEPTLSEKTAVAPQQPRMQS